MTGSYRIRCHVGETEFEVEGPERSYVEQKFSELWAQLLGTPAPQPQAAPARPARAKRAKKAKQATRRGKPRGDGEAKVAGVDAVVSAIEADDDFERVAHAVLANRSQLGRILTALYYADKYGADPYLTVADVERVTSKLGARVAKENVGKVLRGRGKAFVSTASAKKNGGARRVKINQRGLRDFRRMLREIAS